MNNNLTRAFVSKNISLFNDVESIIEKINVEKTKIHAKLLAAGHSVDINVSVFDGISISYSQLDLFYYYTFLIDLNFIKQGLLGDWIIRDSHSHELLSLKNLVLKSIDSFPYKNYQLDSDEKIVEGMFYDEIIQHYQEEIRYVAYKLEEIDDYLHPPGGSLTEEEENTPFYYPEEEIKGLTSKHKDLSSEFIKYYASKYAKLMFPKDRKSKLYSLISIDKLDFSEINLNEVLFLNEPFEKEKEAIFDLINFKYIKFLDEINSLANNFFGMTIEERNKMLWYNTRYGLPINDNHPRIKSYLDKWQPKRRK